MDTELLKQINELGPVITAEEIASLLRVSRQTVNKWADYGLIGAIRPSDRVLRFLREDVIAFVESVYKPEK